MQCSKCHGLCHIDGKRCPMCSGVGEVVAFHVCDCPVSLAKHDALSGRCLRCHRYFVGCDESIRQCPICERGVMVLDSVERCEWSCGHWVRPVRYTPGTKPTYPFGDYDIVTIAPPKHDEIKIAYGTKRVDHRDCVECGDGNTNHAHIEVPIDIEPKKRRLDVVPDAPSRLRVKLDGVPAHSKIEAIAADGSVVLLAPEAIAVDMDMDGGRVSLQFSGLGVDFDLDSRVLDCNDDKLSDADHYLAHVERQADELHTLREIIENTKFYLKASGLSANCAPVMMASLYNETTKPTYDQIQQAYQDHCANRQPEKCVSDDRLMIIELMRKRDLVEADLARTKERLADAESRLESARRVIATETAAVKRWHEQALAEKKNAESWKRRAQQHGCDTERGDPECG